MNSRDKLAKDRTVVFIAIGIVVFLIIALIAMLISKPTRSVVNFCSTYKQQDAVLAKSDGDTYSVRPFTNSTSSPHDFVAAFDKLSSVAPQEVEPDVKTLKQIFEKIEQDPSQALAASVSGLSAEDNVANWTKKNCQ